MNYNKQKIETFLYNRVVKEIAILLTINIANNKFIAERGEELWTLML